jgi:DNA-binding response OmpR family regulator
MELRFLWVDDDGPEMFSYERRRLAARYAAEIDFALTAGEAVRKLADREYRLVLLDNFLPPEDMALDPEPLEGYRLAKRIRAGELGDRLCSLPIIMISAFWDSAMRDLEAVEWATKPIDIELLCEIIDRVVASPARSRVPPAPGPG